MLKWVKSSYCIDPFIIINAVYLSAFALKSMDFLYDFTR